MLNSTRSASVVPEINFLLCEVWVHGQRQEMPALCKGDWLATIQSEPRKAVVCVLRRDALLAPTPEKAARKEAPRTLRNKRLPPLARARYVMAMVMDEKNSEVKRRLIGQWCTQLHLFHSTQGVVLSMAAQLRSESRRGGARVVRQILHNWRNQQTIGRVSRWRARSLQALCLKHGAQLHSMHSLRATLHRHTGRMTAACVGVWRAGMRNAGTR